MNKELVRFRDATMTKRLGKSFQRFLDIAGLVLGATLGIAFVLWIVGGTFYGAWFALSAGEFILLVVLVFLMILIIMFFMAGGIGG